MNELRFAARRLRQSPGFAFTALLVLAIGIGLNTAIFSVVDALLFRPLPFPDAASVVRVPERLESFGEVGSAYPNFLDWSRDAKSFSATASLNPQNATLRIGGGTAERIPVLIATHGFFDVIGEHPAMGREFRASEDQKGAGHRVVITDQLWTRRFARDPGIIGKPIELEGEQYTVTGVMPASFTFPFIKCEAIVPLGPTADSDRGNHSGTAIARLKPGVTRERANAELRAIGAHMADQHPADNKGWSVQAVPLREFFVKDYQPVMVSMLVAVIVVLLIACVNLAGLLLVRAMGRRRELALRKALGAGAAAIVGQSLAESAVLSVVGGAAGILIGSWGLSVLVSMIPSDLPLPPIHLDARVLTFSIATTILAMLSFSLIPAFRSLGADPNDALKDAGRANTGGLRGNRMRSALVVAEIGLALVLALGAGLVTKSFGNLVHVDPGFDASHALTMRVALTGPSYAQDPQQIRFWRGLLKSLRSNPALEYTGLVSFLPLSERDTESGYSVEGTPAPRSANEITFADRFIIGGDYLKAMNIALVRGRAFSESDSENSPGVTIVDEEFVRKNFKGQDPLQHRVLFAKKPWRIVGVLRHVQAFGLQGEQMREQYYFPYGQIGQSELSVVTRPAADNATATGIVRNAVRAVDPGVPVDLVRPMGDYLNDHTWAARLGSLLLAMFAGVALILAGVGVYGVMAYSVAQRTQEIGIRLALGSTPIGVLRLVLRQAAILCLIGIAAGIALSVPVMGALRAVLYKVSPSDAGVFTLASIALALVGLAAGAVPAFRASRTDPMEAIRYE